MQKTTDVMTIQDKPMESLSLIRFGLGSRFYEILGKFKDNIYQVCTLTGRTESCGTIRAKAVQLCLALKRMGVPQDGIIVISSRPHAEETIVVLACLFLSITLAPIDFLFGCCEWMDLMNKLKPALMFCDPDVVEHVKGSLHTKTLKKKVIVFGDKQYYETINFSSLLTFRAPFKEDPYFSPKIVDPVNTVAFIVPTMGITSPIQLICLSHLNMMARIVQFLHICEVSRRIMSYYYLPFGLQLMSVCAGFECKFTRILIGEFSVIQCLKLIQNFRVDTLILHTKDVKQIFCSTELEQYNLTSLKNVIFRFSYTQADTVAYYYETFPDIHFIQTYSHRQTGIIASTPIDEYDEARKRPDACGKMPYFSRVKIMDKEFKSTLPKTKIGNIVLKSDSVMMGYYGSANRDFMVGRYYKTSDVGRFEANEWFYCSGREEDVILESEVPYKFFSTWEVESVVKQHPAVQQAVVLHSNLLLVCCYQVKPNETLTARVLKKFVNFRLLGLKRPKKYIQFDSFPRNPYGDVKRYLVREKVFSGRQSESRPSSARRVTIK
ncbi:luciferin 4-monooxygenase-like [Aethina tumida]|uniref:luciferin 4-monooxygenase-like n=1 Tax=Aethina tumida TaxID=116153 RepID=UPI00096B40F2|nr:luciferin 4-monooxygenase-like [Aethina tumida]